MFNLVSKYKHNGDYLRAVNELVDGINNGKKHQVLLGTAGAGKVFTIDNVIEKVNKKKNE